MSFDWGLYIQLADELINQQRTKTLQEAYLRSSISRSYYGVFCIARNFLISKGVIIPMANTHKFVIKQYWNSQDKTEKKIGKDLSSLCRERKDADYKNTATVNIKSARTVYQLSIQSFNRLRGIGAI